MQELVDIAAVSQLAHAAGAQVVVDDEVQVFVRDRGVGFDPDGVPSDRQGLAKSIRSRMERRGGSVAVRTAPGRGTEVRLSMARLAEGDETVAPETAEESA